MANEEKSVTYVNYGYKFTEMIDEIDTSIENANAVNAQQFELIVLLENSDKKEKFKEFIESLKGQTNDILNQVNKLKFRRQCLKEVEELCKTNPAASYAVSMLLEGLGLENQECKTVQERQETNSQ